MTSASSRVSPVLDSARMTSSAPIMPRSPWLASVACTNMATEPVEARVAAILRPMCPDLPMPVQTIRPLALNRVSTAPAKEASSAAASCVKPSASAASTRRPTAIALNSLMNRARSLRGGDGLRLQVPDRIPRLVQPLLGGFRLAPHGGLHGGRALHRRVAEGLRRAVAQALRPDQRQRHGADRGKGQEWQVEAVKHAGPIAG